MAFNYNLLHQVKQAMHKSAAPVPPEEVTGEKPYVRPQYMEPEQLGAIDPESGMTWHKTKFLKDLAAAEAKQKESDDLGGWLPTQKYDPKDRWGGHQVVDTIDLRDQIRPLRKKHKLLAHEDFSNNPEALEEYRKTILPQRQKLLDEYMPDFSYDATNDAKELAARQQYLDTGYFPRGDIRRNRQVEDQRDEELTEVARPLFVSGGTGYGNLYRELREKYNEGRDNISTYTVPEERAKRRMFGHMIDQMWTHDPLSKFYQPSLEPGLEQYSDWKKHPLTWLSTLPAKTIANSPGFSSVPRSVANFATKALSGNPDQRMYTDWENLRHYPRRSQKDADKDYVDYMDKYPRELSPLEKELVEEARARVYPKKELTLPAQLGRAAANSLKSLPYADRGYGGFYPRVDTNKPATKPNIPYSPASHMDAGPPMLDKRFSRVDINAAKPQTLQPTKPQEIKTNLPAIPSESPLTRRLSGGRGY